MHLLGQYQNGNYTVTIYNDGSKVRETNEDIFISLFPESIDLKITNKCDMLCAYCHEDSTPDGIHAELLNNKFIDTIKPYTEIAIGGGNPLTHPQLIEFLELLKNRNIIANMTVNQKHFMLYQDVVKNLVNRNLIKGLGVSLINVNDDFINVIKKYSNAVIHIINGIIKLDDLRKLYNHNLKILVLGYKEIRRGNDYYSVEVEKRKTELYENIYEIANRFKVISFDNLAIKQLNLKRLFSEKAWDEFYMGDDGQFTMYIDLVKREFAKNSTSLIRYELMDNIEVMFEIVKSEIK